MRRMCCKTWARLTVGMAALLLLANALAVYVLDPFEHYRKAPYTPRLDNQNYVNIGIARHYDYDNVLIGSSMVENTKTSPLAAHYGGQWIKLATKAGTARNHGLLLDAAYEAHALQHVIYCLDPYAFSDGVDSLAYPLPWYLWNKDPFDDVNYLFNWTVLTQEIPYALGQMIRRDIPDLGPDSWHVWGWYEYNRAAALASHDFPSVPKPMLPANAFEQHVIDNYTTWIEPFLRDHPETTFSMFFPSYSILYWVTVRDRGVLDAQLSARAQITALLLQHDNVRLFDFAAKEDWVYDLDRYRDYSHHRPEMNQETMGMIMEGQGLITDIAEVQAHNQALRQAAMAFKKE